MSMEQNRPVRHNRLTLDELDAVLDVVQVAVADDPPKPLSTGVQKLKGQLIRMQTLQRTRAR